MSDYFDSGICVRTPSWHGKERLLADYPENWADARRLAGIEWEPIAVPDYSYSGIAADGSRTFTQSADDILGHFAADPEHVRVVRSDTGALLDVTNSTREIVTNTEMCEIGDTLLGQPNVKIDTLISVKGGEQVAATLLLDEPFQINGDPSQTLPYFVLINSHALGGGLRAGRTMVRVVCANTASMADMDMQRNEHTFLFRKTKNVALRIEEAKAAIAGLKKDVDEYKAIMNDLAAMQVDAAQTEAFISIMIPMPPEAAVSAVVKRHVEADRLAMRTALFSETTLAVSHTAYGLVQAATEWHDHLKGARSADTKLGRQLLKPQRFKGHAVSLARMAAAGTL